VCLFGYLLAWQQPETPIDVYRRLLLVLSETPVAFTYRKVNDKYENYIVAGIGELEKSLDDFPINYDGTFYNPNRQVHGIISETENGFNITGIEMQFNCPTGWFYDSGYCKVRPVCSPDDINLYRGINFYNFTEELFPISPFTEGFAFHPRVYNYCNLNTSELRNCSENELYTGGESISASLGIPCEPYDICVDRLDRTIHTFPIDNNNRILNDNEFFVCQNGESTLQQCDPGDIFSTIASGCVTLNRCANAQGTLPVDDTSYILCIGGRENLIRCQAGIFIDQKTNVISCRNTACDDPPRINFITLLPFFRYPNGFFKCNTNENELSLNACDNEIGTIVSQLNIQPNLLYQIPNNLFDDFNYPKYILNVADLTCELFNYDKHRQYIINPIISTRINNGLPLVQYNVFTARLDYADYNTSVYYKDGNLIRNQDGRIIATNAAKNYVNFTTTDYLPSVALNPITVTQRIMGELDSCLYLLLCTPSRDAVMNRSSVGLDSAYINGGLVQQEGYYFNAYTQQFTTSFAEAHTESVIGNLPSFQESYIHQYYVFDIEFGTSFAKMVTWTRYGAVLMSIEIVDEAKFEYNLISHKTLPSTSNILSQLKVADIDPLDVAVTSLEHQNYTSIHKAFCLQWVKSYEILEPAAATLIDDIFDIDQSMVYEVKPESI
jgi:hypothetical protein